MAIGAEPISGDLTHFRVWAPKRHRVEVVVESSPGSPAFALGKASDGYFSGQVKTQTGALYRFRLDGESRLYPDPASRFQPDGPHGPSQIIDPKAFRWTDGSWRGVALEHQVIYEMHIGTFTPQGTWAGAIEQLEELAAIGITVIEVMPVADFPGSFGWGYDGVNLFAPTHLYGAPDDMRRFVDRAHAFGIGCDPRCRL